MSPAATEICFTAVTGQIYTFRINYIRPTIKQRFPIVLTAHRPTFHSGPVKPTSLNTDRQSSNQWTLCHLSEHTDDQLHNNAVTSTFTFSAATTNKCNSDCTLSLATHCRNYYGRPA